MCMTEMESIFQQYFSIVTSLTLPIPWKWRLSFPLNQRFSSLGGWEIKLFNLFSQMQIKCKFLNKNQTIFTIYSDLVSGFTSFYLFLSQNPRCTVILKFLLQILLLALSGCYQNLNIWAVVPIDFILQK